MVYGFICGQTVRRIVAKSADAYPVLTQADKMRRNRNEQTANLSNQQFFFRGLNRSRFVQALWLNAKRSQCHANPAREK